MSSTLLVLFTLFAIGIGSAIPEVAKSDAIASHSHEEHAGDEDHSDHAHPEAEKDLKAPEPSKDDHEHPGHDHSSSGHDHKLDHPEESSKATEEAKSNQLEDAPIPVEEKIKEEPEVSDQRIRRGLWKRRLD